MPLLEVKDLFAEFHIGVGTVQAVRGVSFALEEGESLGIVGESGSGKSVTMLAATGLLPGYAEVSADKVLFDGRDVLKMSGKELRRLHGGDVGMVFQDPMTSLNPLYTIGNQLMEPLKVQLHLPRAEARARAEELLRMTNIPDAASRLKQYPHEFSGGMRQRVMIAMAIACNPKLVVADEPTTALDVTIQAQILDLLADLKRKLNTAVIMITHDLGVIAGMCSRILVMYGGIICEQGTAREIFYEPRHPYTWGLLNSIPRPEEDGQRKPLQPIPGTPPDMLQPPPGCPFAPRCRQRMPVCDLYPAPETVLSDTHRVACHLMHAHAPKEVRR